MAVILLTILLSAGLALFAYFMIIHFAVEGDLRNNQPELFRENSLLSFYEKRHDGDIFIVGSSSVNEGVDAYIIEGLLHKNLFDKSVYVLGMNADTPLQRVCEIDYIVSAKPEMVIIGLSFRDLANDTYIYQDRLSLCLEKKQDGEKKILQNKFQPFFDDARFEQSPVDQLFDKRKYIYPSFYRIIQRILNPGERWPDLYVTDFKDPWVHQSNLTEGKKKSDAEKNLVPGNRTLNLITADTNPQKAALLYSIDRLQENGITVILVDMPVNPYYSNITNAASRANLHRFFNSTGVLWYDYEQEYPSVFFTDTNHLNVAGRTEFSKRVSEIIMHNLVKGE